jgi:hypothetical protein
MFHNIFNDKKIVTVTLITFGIVFFFFANSNNRGTKKHLNIRSSNEVRTYRLQHPGSCSGMFWRGNPETGSAPPSNDNWPRNGSLLKGVPITVKGEEYLKVSSFQQAGSSEFVSVEEGTYMLFYQEGPVLHLV